MPQDAPNSTFRSSIHVGLFVRERRRANRMTQRELGQLAGTGTRLISKIERGKPTLRMDSVNAVLAVFGKTLGVVDTIREQGNEP